MQSTPPQSARLIDPQRWVLTKDDTGELLGTSPTGRTQSFGVDNFLSFGDERTALRAWVMWLIDEGFITKNVSLAGMAGRHVSFTTLKEPPRVRISRLTLTEAYTQRLPVNVNELPFGSFM